MCPYLVENLAAPPRSPLLGPGLLVVVDARHVHAGHVPPQVGEGARARSLDGAALEATELEWVPLALVADLVLHRHQLVQVVIFKKPARSSETFTGRRSSL